MTNPTDASDPHHDAPSSGSLTDAVIQQLWDDRYSDSGQVWSGEPNGAVVAEAATLPPGRVLDVGCGEGADAVWLALRGWDVTALDVSSVALNRAQQAAEAARATVRWLHAGLLGASLPADGFDLVIALYPALMRTPDHDAERALLAAVAPGGTLLFVHHVQFGIQSEAGHDPAHDHGHDHAHRHGHGDGEGPRPGHGQGIDPGPGFTSEDLVGVEDIRTVLVDAGDSWQIETHEQRAREVHSGAGAGFTQDVVLRARRLG